MAAAPPASSLAGATSMGSPSAITRLVKKPYAPSFEEKRDKLTFTAPGEPAPSTYRSVTTRSRPKPLYTSHSPSKSSVQTLSRLALAPLPKARTSPLGSMQ